MQSEVRNWIKKSVSLKANLERWVQLANQNQQAELSACYHEKARVFPLYGSLKVGRSEIRPYLKNTAKTSVSLHYRTLAYQIEENMIEGEYTFSRPQKADIRAKFAFKFDSNGVIVEHASAPLSSKTWHLKSEVSVCTLLTAATVKSVLNDNPENLEEESLLNQIKKESSSSR